MQKFDILQEGGAAGYIKPRALQHAQQENQCKQQDGKAHIYLRTDGREYTGRQSRQADASAIPHNQVNFHGSNVSWNAAITQIQSIET